MESTHHRQKSTQRRRIFFVCTIFRLAKPAFFRYNDNFTLVRDFYVACCVITGNTHLILIFSLNCQLFLLISGYYTTCNIKITYQCKIIIIPEEGWFGQPKYSTHKKDPSTLCRLLPLFSSFYM